VVKDVTLSAFDSAGQRCSALRVLYLQEDIAEPTLKLLQGHLNSLRIGDPWRFDTDIGPVISKAARASLNSHIEAFKTGGRFLFEAPMMPKGDGYFVAPAVLSLQHLQELTEEIFGPVLHVIRFRGDALDQVIAQIRQCGYGLTFGVHTRIESTWQRLVREIPAGNIYINRNMIGATVGVQPFGGQGLSGTGPKAGGPHYLLRLVHEKTVTHNTSAIGGNAQLLTGDEA
jgi:RHH-type proline utilization regulon transcriptional repressor/proline dehydrogenase/delta 1-pyrroline-5-carboxylate dehydrogenase